MYISNWSKQDRKLELPCYSVVIANTDSSGSYQVGHHELIILTDRNMNQESHTLRQIKMHMLERIPHLDSKQNIC